MQLTKNFSLFKNSNKLNTVYKPGITVVEEHSTKR